MPGIEPVRWYRLADGFLALAGDAAEFTGRFHEIHHPCAVAAPPDGPPLLQCRVRTGSRVVTVECTPGFPTRVLRELLVARGYAPDPGPAAGLRRCPGPPGWPAVSCGDDVLEVTREGPWQWLLAHLLISGVLALQPDLLCFHAGAVAVEGAGVLLMGPSGAGKTSLTLALVEAGHGFLSDEIGALRLGSGGLVAVPRAALRRDGGARRLPHVVPAGRRPGDEVALAALVSLGPFASRTSLTPVRAPRAVRALTTPLRCSLADDPGRKLMRWLRIVSGVPCFRLDAASPDSAARAIVAAVRDG